jgi:hypothetical protein
MLAPAKRRTTRERLIAKGYLDARGDVTPAGDAWTDEQIAKLRRHAIVEA